MDVGSDKGSNIAGKTGGASVNLTESAEVEQGGVPRENEMAAEEVKSSEPTTEGLLLGEDKASVEVQGEEKFRKFKERKALPTRVTPVSIFLEQVWEQILAELEDSEDILNVFRAFPYLEGQVLKNKFWWLFDQVVPHLRPWLSNEVLLSCRLVCKKWAHGVENHLENLPFRTVVEHERQRPITGQVWYPKGSKGYYDYKLRYRDNKGCGVSFGNTGQLTQFLHDMDKHPSSRNPFLGRSVKFEIPSHGNGITADRDRVVYLNAAMEILQKYGRHVWFLDLTYWDKYFFQLVHEVTLLVPNLKALRLKYSSYHDIEELDRFTEEEGSAIFPRLSKLKSLDLSLVCHPNVNRAVMPSNFVNSAKLQRLCISQSCMWEYGTFFPGLRELKLTQIGNPHAIFSQLTSLNAPNLSKLSLYVTTLEQDAPSCYVKLDDILSWIKLFPGLQEFSVEVKKYQYQCMDHFYVVGPPVFDCVPSIKSILISWKDVYLLGPPFLRSFPSLEYAMIFDDIKIDGVRFFRQEWVMSKTLYEWNLWEELPSLKEISFHTDSTRLYEGLPTFHNRATYESLKKKKQQERQERQRPLSDKELQECIEGFESMVSGACVEEQVDFDDGTVWIFPEEVWEQILRKLEDSEDIMNVFRAYPYLEGRVLKNKYWWLFDQVVPHLRRWITNREMLSCRLVCTKWAQGVENHLENLHKVVEHVRPITGYVSYPEGSQAHRRYKLRALDKIGCKVSPFELNQFSCSVDKHPSAGNPFLGRSLKVTSMWENAAHLDALMEILRKCGHHLWFINLDYSGNNFCQLVIDVTSLVPNLKGIELKWQPHSNEVFQEDQRALLPHLPHLESLKFDKYMPPNFMRFFVRRYSAQIKSLSINQREWRKSSLVRFPKLRELRLQQVCYDHDQPDDIHELLTYFGSPDLTKLCMEVEYDGSYHNLTDILSWVGVFPKLQHFGLKIYGKDSSSADYIEQPVLHRVPSIKSLSISWTTAYLSASEFLRWFPSLEYAKIDAHDDSYRYKRDRLNEDVYLWEVWKETPSLKEINIYQRYGLPSHYNRIRYEWLKKQREGPPRPLTDEELQECIEGFESMVSGSWGKRGETLEEALYRLELDDGYGYEW